MEAVQMFLMLGTAYKMLVMEIGRASCRERV